MDILLAGGLMRGGRLERRVALKELTGSIEQRIGELLATSRSWPALVTGLLEATVAEVGDTAADGEALAGLCVADRRYLMLRLLAELQGEEFWISASCAQCAARFDLGLDRSRIPLKPAGEGFPFAVAQLWGRSVQLRVPDGADQAAIAEESPHTALEHMLGRCVVAVDGEAVALPQQPSEQDIGVIEAALDAVSPDVASQLLTRCPECGCEQVVEYDPCVFPPDAVAGLYEEVHVLASHYHWAERDILAMPRSRRRMYLGFVERSRSAVH